MLIIENARKAKILKHISLLGDKKLFLIRNLTNELVNIEATIQEFGSYYTVDIPELENGEYTYKIMLGDDMIETGLLYYGELKNEKTEYTTEENKVYVYGRK